MWGRVVATVSPLPGRAVVAPSVKARRPSPSIASVPVQTPATKRAALAPVENNLDGGWDRRLSRGLVAPDRSIDLHGLTLDRAYGAIDGTLDAAIRAGDRIVLMVTGKARPDVRSGAGAGAGAGRGAIRAVVGDWLAVSRHAGSIAAVRNAHPRHGGDGALYVILRRR